MATDPYDPYDPYFGDTGQPWAPHDAESQLLASLLRGARLTLLYGPPRAGKSTLLQAGLLPLLRRRHSDATGIVPPANAGNIVHWSDRRRRHEIALLFDTWGEQAVERLKARLQDNLSVPPATRPRPAPPLKALLQQLHADTGAHFLLVLDAFEYCLDPPPALADVADHFIDELLDLIDDPRVPAHVLLAVRDDAEPLLGRFRARIRGFDHHFLRLPPRPGLHDDESGPLHTEPPIAPALPELPPREPMVTAELYDSIAAALASIAPREAPAAAPAVRVDVAAHTPAPAATPSPPPSPRVAAPPAPVPATTRSAAWRRHRVASFAGAVTVALTLAWWAGEAEQNDAAPALAATGDTPLAPPAAAMAVPAAAEMPVARPSLVIVSSEDDGSTTAAASADLARWVAPAAGLGLRPQRSAGWLDTLARLREPGNLAVVRYDTLQAARRLPGASVPPLRVVTPLFREELHLLVRADSPLQFIHQIKGRRLNVGALASSRALTAQTLYAGLYGQPLPASQADAQDEAAALQSLLAGGGVEVLVHVDAQPSRWLASLPPAVAGRLKLLRLDATNPASRRALRQFLPSSLRASGTPTLAMMAFLIAPAETAPSNLASLGPLAQGLCSQIDLLRREGQPAWREFQPGLQLEVGWPAEDAAARGFRRCAEGGPLPAASPGDRGSTVESPNDSRSRS